MIRAETSGIGQDHMNLMQATLYGILIWAPPAPFGCHATKDPHVAMCSNDKAIREFADGTLEYDSKYTVKMDRRRNPVFSTGITAHFDSFGWLQFSNGYALRRMEGNVFKVSLPNSNGADITCRYTDPDRQTSCTPG